MPTDTSYLEYGQSSLGRIVRILYIRRVYRIVISLYRKIRKFAVEIIILFV